MPHAKVIILNEGKCEQESKTLCILLMLERGALGCNCKLLEVEDVMQLVLR